MIGLREKDLESLRKMCRFIAVHLQCRECIVRMPTKCPLCERECVTTDECERHLYNYFESHYSDLTKAADGVYVAVKHQCSTCPAMRAGKKCTLEPFCTDRLMWHFYSPDDEETTDAEEGI